MDERHIVIFDGMCNLCNGAVDFIIRRDPDARFAFVAIQSETGQALLQQYEPLDSEGETFVLLKQGVCYLKSDAALEIARDFRGFWRWLRVFGVFPRPVRDGVYRLLARNRYRLFGRRAVCRVPTDNVRQRFLE